MRLPLTPPQTVGPFFHNGLLWPDGSEVAHPSHPSRITLTGRILDGEELPVDDALVETWQADESGRYLDEAAADGSPLFRAFGRVPTDGEGRYRIVTVKPGPTPLDGRRLAPHVDVSIFARGLVDRVVTRIYFADEPELNATDPLLTTIDPALVDTLLATPIEGGYELDIRLQGARQTAFLRWQKPARG